MFHTIGAHVFNLLFTLLMSGNWVDGKHFVERIIITRVRILPKQDIFLNNCFFVLMLYLNYCYQFCIDMFFTITTKHVQPTPYKMHN